MPTAAPSLPVPLAPPDERFWHRYSPHHEFPLSSAISIGLHVLALVLLGLLGWWVAHLATQQSTPVAEVPVAIYSGGGNQQPGRGGNQVGLGGDQQLEDVGPRQEQDRTSGESPRVQLQPPGSRPVPLPSTDDKDNLGPLLREVEINRRVTAENLKKLKDGLRGPGGPGVGKDKAPPGLGTPTKREKRQSRWVMVFDTYSGEDYARQLAGLGAFLAIPHADGNSVSYRIIRDLHARPVRLELVDLAEIGRIHWEDDKRESIEPLCRALGIRPTPDHILAFFPEGLERKLLRLELDYRGRREEQIKETRFKVWKTAAGYEPVVIDQRVN